MFCGRFFLFLLVVYFVFVDFIFFFDALKQHNEKLVLEERMKEDSENNKQVLNETLSNKDEEFIQKRQDPSNSKYPSLIFVDKRDGEYRTIYNSLYRNQIRRTLDNDCLNEEYEPVCFLGATNVGKSTFSNEFFGTEFAVMDSEKIDRKRPTTYGVMSGFHEKDGNKFMLIDTQGLNSGELKSEKERRIDKKTALFSFLLGRKLWFHLNENDVAERNLENLIQPLLESYLSIKPPKDTKHSDLPYLFEKRTLVFFVHRMDIEAFFKSNGTRNEVIKTVKDAFTEAKKGSNKDGGEENILTFEDFFDIEVFYFHHYLTQKDKYLEDLESFRTHFYSEIEKKRKTNRNKQKLSDLLHSLPHLWDMVQNNRYVTQSSFEHYSSYHCVDEVLSEILEDQEYILEVKNPVKIEKKFLEESLDRGCRIDRLKAKERDLKISGLYAQVEAIISSSGECYVIDIFIIFIILLYVVVKSFYFSLGMTEKCYCCRMIFQLIIFILYFIVLLIFVINVLHVIGFFFNLYIIEIRYFLSQYSWLMINKTKDFIFSNSDLGKALENYYSPVEFILKFIMESSTITIYRLLDLFFGLKKENGNIHFVIYKKFVLSEEFNEGDINNSMIGIIGICSLFLVSVVFFVFSYFDKSDSVLFTAEVEDIHGNFESKKKWIKVVGMKKNKALEKIRTSFGIKSRNQMVFECSNGEIIQHIKNLRSGQSVKIKLKKRKKK